LESMNYDKNSADVGRSNDPWVSKTPLHTVKMKKLITQKEWFITRSLQIQRIHGQSFFLKTQIQTRWWKNQSSNSNKKDGKKSSDFEDSRERLNDRNACESHNGKRNLPEAMKAPNKWNDFRNSEKRLHSWITL
jgi:hypothetical protein